MGDNTLTIDDHVELVIDGLTQNFLIYLVDHACEVFEVPRERRQSLWQQAKMDGISTYNIEKSIEYTLMDGVVLSVTCDKDNGIQAMKLTCEPKYHSFLLREKKLKEFIEDATEHYKELKVISEREQTPIMLINTQF